jgi:hypothetical protein
LQEKLQHLASDPKNDIKLVSDNAARPIQYQTQDQAIRHYARHGIDGHRARAHKIARKIREEFGEQALKWRAIQDRIKAIPYKDDPKELDEPYDYKNSDQPDDLKSYVHRLELVKQAIQTPDSATLTKRQANHAERVLNEFNDPHGLKVDLSAQYVVVHELSERELTGAPTDDIEDYFACAPWLGDANTNLYRIAQQTGHIEYVSLHLIAPLVGSSEITLSRVLKTDYAQLVGVHAALGLPYFISWRAEGIELHFLDRQNPELNEKIESEKIEQWKKLANWRVNLTKKWSGEPMLEIPVSADKKVEEQPND